MQDDFRGLKEDARALEAQLDQSRGREAKAQSEAHQAREEANAQRQTVPPPPPFPPGPTPPRALHTVACRAVWQFVLG